MKKRITAGLLLMAVLSVVFLYAAHIEPDEPEFCSLCDSAPYHAPCILDTSTGGITELTVYDPHPVKVAELAEIQSGGYFGLSMANGLLVVRNPDAHETSVGVPICRGRMDISLFCKSCRELLASVSEYEYVLLDLYDPEAPRAYPVRDGAVWEMRCYTVSVTQNEPVEEHAIVVRGNLDGE